MGRITLSLNTKPVSRISSDGAGSTHASIGDYEVTVRTLDNGDIVVDVSHRSLAPCSICGHAMMEVKPGHWACPGFYGSPMHFCDPMILGGYDNIEEGRQLARQRLEEYCGCTPEEYLEARERITESR